MLLYVTRAVTRPVGGGVPNALGENPIRRKRLLIGRLTLRPLSTLSVNDQHRGGKSKKRQSRNFRLNFRIDLIDCGLLPTYAPVLNFDPFSSIEVLSTSCIGAIVYRIGFFAGARIRFVLYRKHALQRAICISRTF